MELMSPAGNIESFIAAIEEDADSIYLGLKKYNARFPAQNFTSFELIKVVNFAHSKDKKIYLTLNIDLKSNELEDIAGILSFCEKIKIDAVIVKDPSIILLYNNFFKDKFDIHLSTQSGITSSYGVRFVKNLNVKRVVLARELTLEEIRKCSQIDGIETEIFCQGSMCFSISGRCLMSSYVGGKSGNRGRCTAPCRVLWEHNGEKKTYFSMKDLSLINNLKEIKESGIKALKIEGRLKNYNWVKQITSVYREVIKNIDKDIDLNELKNNLLKFSARDMGTGHIYGHSNLIQDSPIWDNFQKEDNSIQRSNILKKNFKLVFYGSLGFIKCEIIIENFKTDFEIEIPLFEKKKAKMHIFTSIKDHITHNNFINEDFNVEFIDCDNIYAPSSFLRQISEEITKKVSSFYNGIKDSFYNIDNKIKEYIISVENIEKKRILGDYPDKIILNYNQISLIKNYHNITTIVVYINEDIDINLLKKIKNNYRIIIALPQVIFENNGKKIEKIVKELSDIGFNEFEANSFCGMEILKNINCKKHAGIGLAVYNHLATRFYKNLGYISVYAPIEGDISIFKSLSSFSEIETGIIIFGRPELFITRVESKYFKNKSVFSDKYIKIVCYQDNNVKRFVPEIPLSFIGENFKKDNIKFDNLTADLRFFDNPDSILNDIFNNRFSNEKESFFNYFRKLV